MVRTKPGGGLGRAEVGPAWVGLLTVETGLAEVVLVAALDLVVVGTVVQDLFVLGEVVEDREIWLGTKVRLGE